jgi:thioredoxin reductase (NADPH)
METGMGKRDVIIVGAGPAGLSAAIFTGMDGWNTLLLEGNWTGGQVAIAYTVMNYPGFPPGDGTVLMENLEKQVVSPLPNGVGAEIRDEMVTEIDADERVVITEKNQYSARAIILATGSTMQPLGIPGESEFLGRGVSYYAKRDYKKFAGKRVLVVGGGFATAKSGILAASEADEVTWIHRQESMRARPFMVKRSEKQGVNILYNTEIEEIKGDDTVKEVVVVDNRTGERREMAVDWVVICVGTEPNTELARRAGIELHGRHVKTNGSMMTNKEGVFACGEITGCKRHIVTAASSGSDAGMAVSEYLALEKVQRGEPFEGAVNGKYEEEYLEMLKRKGG